MPARKVSLRERPLLTKVFDSIESFVPAEASAYVFSTSPEERSAHSPEWEERTTNVSFIRVVGQKFDYFDAEVGGEVQRISLRGQRHLEAFWSSIDRDDVYIDITGLSHHVWAPLLRVALGICRSVHVSYVEPEVYRRSANPKEGGIFDLSERIEGLRPIHGFAVLDEQVDVSPCFVPLLGFEGARLAYLLEKVEPDGDRVIPVIGVPGFRLDFPFHTYHGNQIPLREGGAWRRVRYAIANDPFSLFYALEDIASDHPGSPLKVAPIGTKPHALGAVLYAIARRSDVELVYDHPVRSDKRTEGSARVLVYHASMFVR